MRRSMVLFTLLLTSILLMSCGQAQATAPIPTGTPPHPQPPSPTPSLTPVPRSESSLRAAAEERGMYVGAAVSAGPLHSPRYAELLGRELNMVTTENAMKFGPIHPNPDRYAFSNADAIVDFAEVNDMLVRGHTLVWHTQLPNWLTKGGFSRDELLEILQEHIQTVVGRYRGRVYAWDVVNEAVAEDGQLRDTIWLQTIGPEYIDLAFQWAHEADPDALLFYNDTGGEGLGHKSDAIYALVQGLQQRGVPIHGIGLQMHISLVEGPSPQELAANIDRLGELGLEVHITEMDVRVQYDGSEVTEERLEAQARVYRDVFETCLSAEKCTSFLTWGLTDMYSWLNFPGRHPEAPLLFDESYQPKPAYYALIDVLRGED